MLYNKNINIKNNQYLYATNIYGNIYIFGKHSYNVYYLDNIINIDYHSFDKDIIVSDILDDSTLEHLIDIEKCANISYDNNLEIHNNNKLNITNITLFISNECNMSCQYCYQDHSNINIMTEKTAKNCIEYLVNNSEEDVSVSLFGGEPFLQMDILEYVTKYASKIFNDIGRNIEFSLITNGTIFNNRIEKFIRNSISSITISLDGPQEIHDESRKYISGEGSHSDIIKNIEQISRYREDGIEVAIAPTLNPKFNYNYKLLYEYFRNLINDYKCKFKLISPCLSYGKYANYLDERYYQSYHDCLECFAKQSLKDCIDFNSISPLLYDTLFTPKYLVSLFDPKKRSRSKCTAGTRQVIVYPNGDLAGCRQVIPNVSKEAIWGNVNYGSAKSNRINLYNKFCELQNTCKHCRISTICNGKCPALDELTNYSTKERISQIFCNIEKHIFRLSLWLYIELKRREIYV